MRLVNFVRSQGINFNVLANGITQLGQTNPELSAELRGLQASLTRLANEINHLAGNIINNTDGGGSDSDSEDSNNPLERLRETIYMNCRDEIDEEDDSDSE